MRFETFEPRIVFDQSLGPAIEFVINDPVNKPLETPELPPDIELRPTDGDFRYSSELVDEQTLDAFIAATESWAEDPRPIYTFDLDDDDAWRKLYNHNPVSVHADGYIVAERIQTQVDMHTLLVALKPQSECHTHGGMYTRPDYHYRYSFEVRHPETELSWLTTTDRHWSVVTELWGPGSAGQGLNPPFAIQTSVQNGVPYWAVSSRGDANPTTVRPYDQERFQYIPMENVGEWHRWDVEYVPNHEGQGLVRAWLNGQLVANWVDVQSSYLGYSSGQIQGPLNPAIGMYSYAPKDGLEAHFDNFTMQCSGVYESSIAGRVTGTETLGGNIVYATNAETGERHGVRTGDSGVYTLELPRGSYTVTAVDQITGEQVFVDQVSTVELRGQIVDLDVTPVAPPPPAVVTTLSGDVTGNGTADVINFMDDGTWRVTVVDEQGVSHSDTWAYWSTDSQWRDVMLGDFNGDGKSDVIGRADNGSWWVAESTGTGFRNVNWGKWTPGIDWLHVSVGDFNGDGKSDIVGRAATNGSWWIGESTGTDFSNQPWGRWTTLVDWEVLVGDFNGDGLSDIAGRASTDGTWWIGASDGTRFLNSYWGRFSQGVPWSSFQVGDFNGDGRSDLVARAETDGTWWVAESQGDRFLNRYFGRWTVAVNWTDIQVTDVDGDTLSDLVGRATSDNSWWIAKSMGEGFQNQYWGATWAENVDWLVALADDFDGDGAADLLGGSPTSWWLSK